jgi:hypothetical protein
VARDPVAPTNTMLLGSSAPISGSRLATSPEPPDLVAQAATEAGGLGPPLPGGAVFTDDRAPVEQLIDGSLISYATSGGNGR